MNSARFDPILSRLSDGAIEGMAYIRVSTNHQDAERQREGVRRLKVVRRLGREVPVVIPDRLIFEDLGESGTLPAESRPAARDLFAAARGPNPPCFIVFDDTSRLTREPDPTK